MQYSQVHQPKLRRAFDYLFLLSALLITVDMNLPFVTKSHEGIRTATIPLPLFDVLYAVTAVVVLTHWRKIVRLSAKLPVLIALVALATASFLWSSVPDYTLRYSVSLILATLIGVYMAIVFTPRQHVEILRWMSGIVVVYSLIRLPLGKAMMPLGFCGAFPHKNAMGRFLTLAIMAVLIGPARSWRRVARWMTVIALMAMLLATHSATGLAITAMFFVVVPVFNALRVRGPLLGAVVIALLFVTMAGGLFAFEHSELVFAALNKDSTMTGRTEIWAAVAIAISRRPWLGYGLGAFWRGFEGPSADVISAVHWMTPHSHNGFLDLALNLGIVGVALFSISYLKSLKRGLSRFRQSKDPYMLWPLTYMTFMFLYNLSESTILRAGSIWWILYMAACTTVLIKRPQERLYAVSPSDLDLNLAKTECAIATV